MDKIKKIYVDSRYKTSDSVSNSDFKFELKEQIDVPDNTVCYIDDISIPHSWYTVENYNNKLYIDHTNSDFTLKSAVLTIPEGNYTATNLASKLQSVLQATFPNENYTCVYNTARGTITITSIMSFRIFTDEQVVQLTNSIGVQFPGWVDHNDLPTTVDINNLMSMNEILRNSESKSPEETFETGFIDLLNVHNIYMHCPNIGHYNCIGVRGENSIIKKIPVSSSFGYLILDSVVAPHDKIDVSRQCIKTMHFTLKNVHGNIINLHGAHISFSLIFQTIE